MWQHINVICVIIINAILTPIVIVPVSYTSGRNSFYLIIVLCLFGVVAVIGIFADRAGVGRVALGGAGRRFHYRVIGVRNSVGLICIIFVLAAVHTVVPGVSLRCACR